MRDSLCTRINNSFNTILDHIDIEVISPRYESSCIVYKVEASTINYVHKGHVMLT